MDAFHEPVRGVSHYVLALSKQTQRQSSVFVCLNKQHNIIWCLLSLTVNHKWNLHIITLWKEWTNWYPPAPFPPTDKRFIWWMNGLFSEKVENWTWATRMYFLKLTWAARYSVRDSDTDTERHVYACLPWVITLMLWKERLQCSRNMEDKNSL